MITDADAGSIGVGGLVVVFIYSAPLPGLATSYGELLVDPASG